LMSGVGLFREDGEVHARRPTADDVDFHAAGIRRFMRGSLTMRLMGHIGHMGPVSPIAS
jgi:hypothetical protein